ncbi:MaoC family dehydratase N-terminal domain-containing protein [Microtetraspora sp. NBRC 16547]|uniref:FAS1-like dehydratase domain-containing protein n=1 Tax=Microtetraspora sp. NBRC 16547 TaxID=3030993 RepID=UPI0024A0B7AB|nr:MaoC family dehydratase N-terminal domain-containing protein [Microtetraspora sp. NBRC 16547]GLW99316.1 hypothetical protein Misp02_34030 [Microtetraspora sp. NBRC 16547]
MTDQYGRPQRLVVDRELCESYGVCASAAPAVFAIGDDDVMRTLQDPIETSEQGRVAQAVQLCPRQALRLEPVDQPLEADVENNVYDIPIERGKIREFARATGSSNPAYLTEQPVVPPTFLTTARLAWEPPDQDTMALVGFDLQRLLHGAEDYEFLRLPRAGETLQVTSEVTERFEKTGKRGGAMKFAIVVTEFRSESGQLVARQRSTLIETGAAPSGEGS